MCRYLHEAFPDVTLNLVTYMAEVCAATSFFICLAVDRVWVTQHIVCSVTPTAVGKGSPQHAADTSTHHFQPSESHGSEWNSSQTL